MNDKSAPIIGKHTLESLTVGMYSDPFTVYREYIQNACDAIDTAVEQKMMDRLVAKIEVTVCENERRIRISDNAIGIKAEDAFSTLCDIGNSYKDHRLARGFRGIGRLGGLGYADRIVFRTSFLGEDLESEISWDAEKLKRLLRPGTNRDMDLVKVISSVTSVKTNKAKQEDHYFIVELFGIDENFPELIDETEIGNYLAMVAPVPFDCQKFIYGKTIKQHFSSQKVRIDEYSIYLNDSPQAITKRYKTNYLTGKQERTSKRNDIHEIEFFKSITSDGEIACIGWLGISDFSGTVDDDFMRGIRVRKGNILIGDESTFNQFFSTEQHRANGVFVGEVHILWQNIIPNARRDDFESNEAFGFLKEKLTEYADSINKKYRRGYSQVNSALRKYEDGMRHLEDVEVEIETAGITSEVHKEKLLEEKNKIEKQLSDAVVELEKAKAKIGDDSRRAAQIDTVLAEHKEKKREIVSLENKIVDSEYKGKDELSFLNRDERKLYKRIIEVIDRNLPKETAASLVAQIIAAIMPGRKSK
jgi:hypothetical protein